MIFSENRGADRTKNLQGAWESRHLSAFCCRQWRDRLEDGGAVAALSEGANPIQVGSGVQSASKAVNSSPALHNLRIPAGLSIYLAHSILIILAALFFSGCSSPRQMAVKAMADALSETGQTFASEPDLELAREATPFGLKLMEAVLLETPEHVELLTALCGGFTQYAYAFVELEADRLEDVDYRRSQYERARARDFYLRARDYGLRALDAVRPGTRSRLMEGEISVLDTLIMESTPILYWTAASWGAAISVDKTNAELIADLPLVEALIYRAFELNPDHDSGAIHMFLIAFQSARSIGAEEAGENALRHFNRAVSLTGGYHAGPFVAYAESVLIPRQEKQEFERLLNRALEIDVDARPEWRLANTLMQRRAEWLLEKKGDLFFD